MPWSGGGEADPQETGGCGGRGPGIAGPERQRVVFEHEIPAIAIAVAAEIAVIRDSGSSFGWLIPVLVAAGVIVAAILATSRDRRVRSVATVAMVAVMMIAPATWAPRRPPVQPSAPAHRARSTRGV